MITSGSLVGMLRAKEKATAPLILDNQMIVWFLALIFFVLKKLQIGDKENTTIPRVTIKIAMLERITGHTIPRVLKGIDIPKYTKQKFSATNAKVLKV
mmetsp:Transcript_2503/g.3931  ORF Transcript_2503/g.3931 Transcript_2503/m.3931 type:complete len:98 (+) Transcript_2503:309-602(+)